MKKFRKILLSALSLVLVVALTIVGTVAFLQDEDGEVNVMTVGNVYIEQLEQQFGANGLEEFVQKKNLYPVPDTTLDTEAFQSTVVPAPAVNVVDKLVSVNNYGKSDAFVRTVFAFEMGTLSVDQFKNVFVYRINNTDWTWEEIGVSNINGAKYFVVVATHNEIVEAKTTTDYSLTQVFLKSFAGNEECEAIDGNGNGTFDVLTMSQAVQTVGFNDADTALDAAFGKIDQLTNPWNEGKAVYDVSTEEQLETALIVGGTITFNNNITLEKNNITIPDGALVKLDLNDNKLIGNVFVGKGATLIVADGTIVNNDSSVSAIETAKGAELVLNDVEINSKRHAVRVDGGKVTINGGVYTVAGAGKTTTHALNVSNGGEVVINDGIFVGAKGTESDSGAAVNVQAGSTVIINGGDFSGGKNKTLSSGGTLVVNGGTFDQDPSAFAGNNVPVQTGDTTWTVYPINDTWDGSADISWYKESRAVTPEYKLYTAEQFAGFRDLVNAGKDIKNANVTLMVNVDLCNREWTPIGNDTNNYSGTFTGKTVYNLFVNMPGKSNAGLFGTTTNGEIKNVTVENATIVGRLNVGVVAGTPYTSKYTNITVKGLVKVDGMAYVGGVGGKNAYANWTNIVVDVEDGSYVKANSVENGKAYRTYVGGVIGFMGEGAHTVSNVYSNIDVIGSTIDVGGITGIAHYGNTFKNVVCEGNVTVANAAEAADADEIGGIAGVWHNQTGYEVTFENCTFTGTLTANIQGVNLKDNTITGKAYDATGAGKLYIDGALQTNDVDTIGNILASGGKVALTDSINNAPVITTAPYGNKYGVALNGGVLDGNGNALNFNSAGDNYGIMTSGGTIKNLTVTGSFRGIVIMSPKADVYIDNVTVGLDKDTVYGLNTAEGDGTRSIYVSNSTLGGWNSFGNTIKSVTFTDCTFVQGAAYSSVTGRLVRPYVTTVFENCDFSDKYYIDLSALVAGHTVTLKNCTVNGVKLTAENWTSLIAPEDTCGAGQISIEGRNGSFMTASNVFDYVVIQ